MKIIIFFKRVLVFVVLVLVCGFVCVINNGK